MAKEVNHNMDRGLSRVGAVLSVNPIFYILYFIFFIWNCLVESKIFLIFATEKYYHNNN